MRGLVLLHSQEKGNTLKMAEAVAEGMRQAGAEVELFNTNDGRFNIDDFSSFDCAAFGSPDYYSYIAGGLKMFIDDHYIATECDGRKGLTGKNYGLFYSHGGGGKVLQSLENLFGRIGDKIGKTVESKGTPGGDVLARCRELGLAIAKSLD